MMLQLALCMYTFRTVYRYNRTDRALALEMKNYPEQTIYSFEINGALRAYGVNNELIDLWETRLQNVRPNALVLINTSKLNDAFYDKNPGINWKFIRQSARVSLIKNLNDGWQLYRIQS